MTFGRPARTVVMVLTVSVLAVAVFVGVSWATTPSIPNTPDAQAIEQLIENEEHDSIMSVIFPTTAPMRYGDYTALMASRVRALDHYYTGNALAANHAKVAPALPSYPPEKVAAMASAGMTIPPLASSPPDAVFDPEMKPIAAGITKITWKSLTISGDTAHVVASVDSWIDYLMQSPAPQPGAVHVPTPAVMIFDCRRIAGEWRISEITIEYPHAP